MDWLLQSPPFTIYMPHSDHNLFFSDRITPSAVLLSNDEMRHAQSVLRLTSEEHITITDGKGNRYSCTVGPKIGNEYECPIATQKFSPQKLPIITLYIGIPDKDPFEEIVTDCTALGVSAIVPVVCDYCQKKWWDKKWNELSGRFEKKIVAALKQSHNLWSPHLARPMDFELAMQKAQGTRLYADMKGMSAYTAVKQLTNVKAVDCFIGPPGGFSPDEAKLLAHGGNVAIMLSFNRLRTELAARMMCGFAGMSGDHL